MIGRKKLGKQNIEGALTRHQQGLTASFCLTCHSYLNCPNHHKQPHVQLHLKNYKYKAICKFVYTDVGTQIKANIRKSNKYYYQIARLLPVVDRLLF